MSLDHLASLLDAAKRAGADAADAFLVSRISVSVERRLGAMEALERAEQRDLSLRVFLGKRNAIVSSSQVEPSDFATLAERAVAMARLLPEDPYAHLAAEASPPEDPAALDLADPEEPALATLIERAQTAEEAALQVQGVTNSEGGGAGWSRTETFLATSAGFAGQTLRTSHSVSASVLAGAGTAMQRDYDYHSASHAADLEDAASIGHRAGERAVARLDPRRPRTATLPVLYDPRVSGSLLGHFVSAINGAAIARGTSFLKDRLGKRVFAPGIAIHDDPRRRRGARSATFDGEGVPTRARALVEDGVLQTWLLDSRSAAQLGLASTGNASRGGGTPNPASSNLYLAPGTVTPAALMADIAEGLYITEMIGNSLNQLTGDYSRGASGFMIRNGALAEPVAEITVAGNLLEMFARLVPANDLEFRRVVDAPTVRIDGLVVAGA